MDTSLERFHPILLHSLLTATRRFEPSFYESLCRQHSLDADRILGLFTAVEEIGPGPLQGVLSGLRNHSAYHDIVHLAGRNSLLGWSESHRVKLDRSGGAVRFNALLRQWLPDFAGRSGINYMQRGSVLFVELRDSVFARGVEHEHTVCGFYSGFMGELWAGCQPRNPVASEVRCRAIEPSAPSCMFQVQL